MTLGPLNRVVFNSLKRAPLYQISFYVILDGIHSRVYIQNTELREGFNNYLHSLTNSLEIIRPWVRTRRRALRVFVDTGTEDRD